jgi:hypothetical protein
MAAAAAPATLPIRIICIIDNYSDVRNNPIIEEIREHAHAQGASFHMRLYNSRKKSEDRDYVERLPAFHAYVKRAYVNTFYPNTEPIQRIDETIQNYVKEVVDRRKRVEKWRSRVGALAEWFRQLVQRTARIEQYAEDVRAAAEGRVKRFPQALPPLPPVREWN